ncbi:MAG: hypothetical protein V1688_02010 [bacterium]
MSIIEKFFEGMGDSDPKRVQEAKDAMKTKKEWFDKLEEEYEKLHSLYLQLFDLYGKIKDKKMEGKDEKEIKKIKLEMAMLWNDGVLGYICDLRDETGEECDKCLAFHALTDSTPPLDKITITDFKDNLIENYMRKKITEFEGMLEMLNKKQQPAPQES